MSSAFFTVQFVVVAMLASAAALTLGRWLRSGEYRVWSSAWLAWAMGAASLSLCPMAPEAAHLFLIVHTVAYAAFSVLLALGTRLTIKTQDVSYARIRSMHWVLLGVMSVVTVGIILWRWSAVRPGIDFWQERYFWSGPWLIAYPFFSIWIVSKHKARWSLRPPIVLFVLALLLVATLEGVVAGVLLGYEGRLMPTTERLLEFLMFLGPILAAFLALAMTGMLMDNLVYHLERNLVSSSRQTAKLKRLAERDPLTAVLNRHAFYSLMGASRDKKRPLGGSVAVIDIDNLKPMNDTYGHVAGDAAIRSVAKAVRSIIRAEDLLFRWGGDEFLVILPHVAQTEARIRLSKLDHLLQGVTLPGAEQPVAITLSVGISEFSPELNLEQAIEEADEKMYALKLGKKAV